MSIVPYWNAGELRRSARPGGSRVWYNRRASNDLGGISVRARRGPKPGIWAKFSTGLYRKI